MADLPKYLALGQGVYFLLTGVWPWVSIRTFQMVTGPKQDLWLVKTVGALVAVIGAVLLATGLAGAVTAQTMGLAIGSAAVLTWIDIWYVVRRVISGIYLADAAAELALIAGWAVVIFNSR